MVRRRVAQVNAAAIEFSMILIILLFVAATIVLEMMLGAYSIHQSDDIVFLGRERERKLIKGKEG